MTEHGKRPSFRDFRRFVRGREGRSAPRGKTRSDSPAQASSENAVDLFLTRRNAMMKSDALSGLSSGALLTSLKTASQEDPTSRAQKAEQKRLTDMQDAVAKLRAMPSARVSRKQMAAKQAETLKRRLEMLKQMLIGASPEMAKSIAAQIKSIAKELAGLAKLLSSNSGNSASSSKAGVSVTPDAGADGESAAPANDASAAEPAATETVSAETAVPAPDTSNQADEEKEEKETASAKPHEGIAAYAAQNALASRDSQESKNDDQEKGADKALKKALSEAMAVLRQVIAMLKSKSGASKKTTQDIRDADAQLRDMERSLSKADSPADSAARAVSLAEVGSTTSDVSAGSAGAGISVSVNVAV